MDSALKMRSFTESARTDAGERGLMEAFRQVQLEVKGKEVACKVEHKRGGGHKVQGVW